MATETRAQGGSLLWGHPRGLYYLAGTELWERFSFYGMQALLTLYMVKRLLLPEFAQNVWGLAGLRSALGFGGTLTDIAFASLIAGWYSGLVYFTPVIGGWIADRILGAKRTVTIGVLLMSAGHLAMTFDQLFLVALVLLILGSGCLKGNIASQVGTLYPREAQSQRDRGFAIFSTGINIGAATGPLVTGTVKEIWGWHAGFGVAAALLLLALAMYLAGQKHLPETRPRQQAQAASQPLTGLERRKVWALIAVIAMIMPAEITYPMVWSIGLVWVDKYVSLGFVPSTWFGAMDSIGSIIAAPLLIRFWASQAKRGREPGSIGKIAIGTALTAVGALFLAAGSFLSPGEHAVPIFWALAGYLTMGLAWMYYLPNTLSLVSRVAPAAMTSTLVGGVYVSPFVAHVIAGYVGTRFDKMDPAAFWVMDASIAVAGALLLFAAQPRLLAILDRQDEPANGSVNPVA